jgi:predicted site-specific integrase-resolvase
MNVRDTSDVTPQDAWLTAAEAAPLIPTASVRMVQRWMKDGRLPSVLLPNGRRVTRREDVEALLSPSVPSRVA